MFKQVIVIRKDLNMRKGKMCAQAAHASVTVLVEGAAKGKLLTEWMRTGQTKIVVGVDSERELFEIYKAAERKNLLCSLIQDAGRTEFKEPTYTAVAVGPDLSEAINLITGNLKLL